jgi:hypothetical protein
LQNFCVERHPLVQKRYYLLLEVDVYNDSNGDGIGDFVGLRQGLNYLADLGINCVWLLRFFRSPDRDAGYDVVEFREFSSLENRRCNPACGSRCAAGSYLADRNRNPKKYVWRASGLRILEKIRRAREALAATEVIYT